MISPVERFLRKVFFQPVVEAERQSVEIENTRRTFGKAKQEFGQQMDALKNRSECCRLLKALEELEQEFKT